MIASLKFPERWEAGRDESRLLQPWQRVEGECRPVTLKEAKELATKLFLQKLTYHEPHNVNTVWVLVEFADANGYMLWLQTDGEGCVEVQLCASQERH